MTQIEEDVCEHGHRCPLGLCSGPCNDVPGALPSGGDAISAPDGGSAGGAMITGSSSPRIPDGPQCNGICVTGAELGVPIIGGIAYPHPDCELHGDPDYARRLRLADQGVEAAQYLARGGDRIQPCPWCDRHDCPDREGHRVLMAQREQTWRER